ncbi:MAG: hypothetical protein WCP16_04095 [Pseudanabaena sp. ELA645]|jgi:hypothetical protein
MKVIIAAIAALGAMNSFMGSAIADVSISINFGSRPAYSSPNYYNPYRTNVYRGNVYSSPSIVHSPTYNGYYNRNFNSVIPNSVIPNSVIPNSVIPNSVIKVREVYPSRVIYSTNLSDRRYNSYRSDQYVDQYGDRYIVENRSR